MVPEKGKTYFFEYGFELVQAKCVAVGDIQSVFLFRWGSPIKRPHLVLHNWIISEAD